MKVEFTLKRFPINGRLKEQCGLPFSCVLQPFARLTSDKDLAAPGADASGAPAGGEPDSGVVPSDLIARCGHCYAYINCYCMFDASGWTCSLCNRHNKLKPQQQRRYPPDASALSSLPEVRNEVFETLAEEPLLVQLPPPPPAGGDDQLSLSGPAPVFVALVDTASGPEFLELVRSSLEAALEALPPVTRVAIISMSHRIGLYDLRAAEPTVRFVSLLEPVARPGSPIGGPAPAPAVSAPLSEVLPLSALLAPLGSHKAALTRALEELLAPEQGFGDSLEGSSGAPVSSTTSAAPSDGAAPGPHAAMNRSGAAGGVRPIAARGLGPALVAVLDYLKVLQSAPFLPPPAATGPGVAAAAAGVGTDHLPRNPSPVKLMCFLAGVPDFGIGRLMNPRRRRRAAAAAAATADAAPSPHASNGLTSVLRADDSWLEDVPASATQFYEQAAAAAASLGVSVDLFAVCGGALGLRHLDPLASSTGGAVYLYPSVDESAMPQDVYLRLSASPATSGILRLRTSPHFRPVRHYGRLFPDPTIPDLHHIIAADPSDAFAVDFEFTTPNGFSGVTSTQPPTLQLAFQYTALVAGGGPRKGAGAQGQGAANGGGGEGRQYWLQRRLRVATYRVATAATVADVYAHAQSDAVVALLMHKIMRAAEKQGFQEARLLLRDWLVVLALNYHRNVHAGLSPQQLAAVPADLHFSQAPCLAPLPRLVYALLRSPLLAPVAEGQHPDLTAFLAHLWAGLPPKELVRAVYPVMQSYSHPDQLAYPRHSLSRAVLEGPDAAPIFLLDAYILIMVYYTARCPPDVPYPPPQQSALRKAVAAIRAERRITPQVKILHEGSEEAELFDQLLLDEPDGHDDAGAVAGGQEGQQAGVEKAGGGGGGGFGLVQFLEHVQLEGAMQLQHEAAQAPGGGGGAGKAAGK